MSFPLTEFPLDRESLDELGGRLRSLMRQGVGSNTRCGTCDFVAVACMENPSAWSPATGASMLKTVALGLLDPSVAVRSSAASAFATLSKRVDDKRLLARCAVPRPPPGPPGPPGPRCAAGGS